MSVVEYVTGDLFDQRDVHALGQGVNTVGLMGAGIATQFKARWPDMFDQYRARCQSGGLTPGGLHAWQVGPEHWVYNLATQPRPGKCARLEYLEESLGAALTHAEAHNVPSLALPRVGTGYGGLSWPSVRGFIERVVAPSPVKVRVVTQ